MASEDIFVVTICLLLFLHVTSSAPTTNATDVIKYNTTGTANPAASSNVTMKSPYSNMTDTMTPKTMASTLKHCTLTTKHDVPLKIKDLLAGGASLIKYQLNIPEAEKIFEGKNSSLMYRQLFWIRSTGRQGTGLLLLRPTYDKLSLHTLEIGVRKMSVDVIQEPSNCLRTLNDDDIEKLFRVFVMNDFQNTSSGVIVKLKPTDHVCNMHMINNAGTAEFKYICCQRNEYDEIHCSYLAKDMWLNILFIVITVIKLIVILFSPRMVPEVYYRVKHLATSYKHDLKLEEKLVLNTVTTMNPDNYPDAEVRVKLSKLRTMASFKKFIAGSKLERPRFLELNQINLRVKHDRLLPEDYAPVSLVTTLYESIFKCGIRRRPALKECCGADFLGKSPCGVTVTWYRMFRSLMRVVMLILLAVPWILRIAAYYAWEHDEMHLRKDAAHERGMRFYFPGNFTLLLTPLHALFLFIYIFLCIESCIFGVLGRKVKERLKMVLRKCFQDMREMSKMEVVGWAIKTLIKPCTAFGGFGICLGAFFWIPALPILSVIVAFYLLPTLNITFRLLAHFAIHIFPRDCCTRVGCLNGLVEKVRSLEINLEMEESISRREHLERKHLQTYSSRVQQLFVIFMCLISMYSIIFLISEFISFLVEVFVYTLMGIILNAATILTYVSLIFILGVYANECFGHVSEKFLVFNNKLHEIIMAPLKKKVEKLVQNNEENFAFRVQTEYTKNTENPVTLNKNSEGELRWNVKRLCLFLSKTDQPWIPYRFYFQACHMPYYLAPGELLVNYLKATIEFLMIVIFLVFVLIVVMAFGDTYEISATNKLLATVTGGLLPFMLRKVIFKAHSLPEIDDSNIHFQARYNELLDNFSEDWPIYDFDVKEDETENGTSLVNDVFSDIDKTETEASLDQNGGTRTGNGTNGSIEAECKIDLLIDMRDIDRDEFPEVHRSLTAGENPANIGSTSLLEDSALDPATRETELRNIV